MLTPWDRFLGRLVEQAYKAHFKGHRYILRALYTLMSDNIVKSVYGPWLSGDWSDATFRFSTLGDYGNDIFDIIKKIDTDCIFLDIGANTGLFSFVAEKNACIQHCYTFEPNKVLFQNLERNKTLNNSAITPLNFGIGTENTVISFDVDPNHSGKGHISKDGTGTTKIKIKNHDCFNEIADKHPSLPAFCKIDVEGYEAIVAEQLKASKLAQRLCGCVVEIDERRLTSEQITTVRDAFIQCGLKQTGQIGNGNHYDLVFEK